MRQIHLAATTFGIALPKWIVSKEYGIWVLAAYGLLFMVILPTSVVSFFLYSLFCQVLPSPQGIWWYNSIKYTSESVLMDTQRFRGSELLRVPSMNILSALLCLYFSNCTLLQNSFNCCLHRLSSLKNTTKRRSYGRQITTRYQMCKDFL